jgi:hypothetical protein
MTVGWACKWCDEVVFVLNEPDEGDVVDHLWSVHRESPLALEDTGEWVSS